MPEARVAAIRVSTKALFNCWKLPGTDLAGLLLQGNSSLLGIATIFHLYFVRHLHFYHLSRTSKVLLPCILIINHLAE